MQNNKDFCYQFTSSKNAEEIFPILLDVNKWWKGFYDEKIDGESKELGDEFTFSAGDGAHFSIQKLVEKIPDKKLVWLVTESNLSFLENKKEWENTKISFDLEETENGTNVKFKHNGLTPEIECFENCSSAWTNYLGNLKILLK